MSEFNKLSTKYMFFSGLMLCYHEDTYTIAPVRPPTLTPLEFAKACDLTIIKDYVKRSNRWAIERVILEGQEVLAMPLKDFPDEWISSISLRRPFDESHGSSQANYYHWVKWVINELKDESKKQDKYAEKGWFVKR